MNREKQVLRLVDALHRLDAKFGRPGLRWDPDPWLIGWIKYGVKPDNGESDRQARVGTQVAIEAYERFLAERAEVRAVEVKYEREDPVTGEPLPPGVTGFPVSGR